MRTLRETKRQNFLHYSYDSLSVILVRLRGRGWPGWAFGGGRGSTTAVFPAPNKHPVKVCQAKQATKERTHRFQAIYPKHIAPHIALQMTGRGYVGQDGLTLEVRVRGHGGRRLTGATADVGHVTVDKQTETVTLELGALKAGETRLRVQASVER